MLFQGEEFASSAPFLYFADHETRFRGQRARGAPQVLGQFPSLALAETQKLLADPADRKTFERCKLDFRERDEHAEIYALHKDLLALRRSDAVLKAMQDRTRGGVDGFVLGEQAFGIRYMSVEGDRLLLVNLGRQLEFSALPEPLFAPPLGMPWRKLWSSNEVAYGGDGTPDLEK